MTVAGIVVAAGRGERFGLPKAGIVLRDRPLWQWGRDALLHGGVTEVVVVGDVPGGIPGGERRRDSVAAGLAAISADATHVVVHDAARPLATPDLVRALLERISVGDVAAVVPAVPVRDTMKRVRADRVVETVDRDGLVSVQTPQAFTVAALRSAHAAGDEDASDDALLVERIGGSVATIMGEVHNLKITFPDDLLLADRLLP